MKKAAKQGIYACQSAHGIKPIFPFSCSACGEKLEGIISSSGCYSVF